MPSSPSAANLSFGPGILRWAPLGTTEPTGLVDAWPAGWVQLGYTPEGNQWTYSLTVANAEVAELLDPVKRTTTGRDIQIAFALAEITAAHLKVVLNGGTITPEAGGSPTYSTYEPPELGGEVRCMLGWDADDALERAIYRQCLQIGDSATPRRKGTEYARFGATFGLEVPATGAKPFAHRFATARVAA